MAGKRRHETDAADPKVGMTLDEIAAWVEEMRRVGIAGDALPSAVIKIGSGRIKRLKVTS